MSIISWIVVAGIIGVAVYALILVTFPIVYKKWENEDEYAKIGLKRRLASGEIDNRKYQAMVEMHRKSGHCNYC